MDLSTSLHRSPPKQRVRSYQSQEFIESLQVEGSPRWHDSRSNRVSLRLTRWGFLETTCTGCRPQGRYSYLASIDLCRMMTFLRRTRRGTGKTFWCRADVVELESSLPCSASNTMWERVQAVRAAREAKQRERDEAFKLATLVGPGNFEKDKKHNVPRMSARMSECA